MVGAAGVTEMETRAAGVTVRVAEPLALFNGSLAVMVVTPVETEVARPFESPVLLTLATAVFNELQVTEAVMSRSIPSEKVPVALNCAVNPLAMLGLTGVTEMDKTIAGATVRVVVPCLPVSVSVA